MAWEQRAGQFYFYEKYREGRRVVSRYMGGGALGGMAAELSAAARREREQQRQQSRKIRDEQKKIDRELARAEAAIAGVT